jgi:hypothetical protein
VQYGDFVHLVSQYNPSLGYLDVYGDSGYGGYSCKTDASPHRDGGSGTWKIYRNDMSEERGPVHYGDMVKLINEYYPPYGHLDVLGYGPGGGYNVMTSPEPNRDGGSGTWMVVKNDLSGGTGPVPYSEMLKLVNQFNPANGYLDVNGLHEGGGFDVVTSNQPNRDTSQGSGSGTWLFVHAAS